jgi:hypothetical protein
MYTLMSLVEILQKPPSGVQVLMFVSIACTRPLTLYELYVSRMTLFSQMFAHT